TLAVPFVVLDDMDRITVGVNAVEDRQIYPRQHPIASEGRVAIVKLGLDHGLGLLDQAIVLGVENVMDRGQRDVLVGAAVAGDVVRLEQLVVVEARSRWGAAGNEISVGYQMDTGCVGIARRRTMRDVIQEGMSGADSTDRADGT